MSIWTPYVSGQPLDLRKTGGAVVKTKVEPLLPCPPVETGPLLYPHHMPSYQPYELPPGPLQHGPTLYEGCSPPPSTSPDSENGSSSCRLPPRPFKALTVALPACGQSAAPDPRYLAFRASMLEAMRARNGGSLTVSNPRMRRAVHRNIDVGEDADYLQRRARNNAAAKRSRDLRKQKEDELAIRVAFLERQNAELREKLDAGLCPRCVPAYPGY